MVTNGDRSSQAISNPLISPIAAARASPATTGTTTEAYGTPPNGDPATQRITIIEHTATSAHTDPTERSIPPVMMTTVMPSDINAI